MRVYLDNCCVSRPFDSQAQDLVRLETEAMALIFQRLQTGQWTWVVSDASFREAGRDPQVDRRDDVQALLEQATVRVRMELKDVPRAAELHALGFHPSDAYHIVAAEKAQCDVLLSTDVRMVRRAARYADRLRVKIRNPLQWLTEIPQ